MGRISRACSDVGRIDDFSAAYGLVRRRNTSAPSISGTSTWTLSKHGASTLLAPPIPLPTNQTNDDATYDAARGPIVRDVLETNTPHTLENPTIAVHVSVPRVAVATIV